MSTKSWTVDADGLEHLVTLDHDPATGRTSIRVDGKMAARPLAADENERSFPVGSVGYVVRRAGKDFELDFAPLDLTQRPKTFSGTQPIPKSTAAAAAQANKSGVAKFIPIIIGVVALIGIVGLFGRGKPPAPRQDLKWMPYAADDGSFKVNFPGEPTLEADSEFYDNIRYTSIALETLVDEQHAYRVEYVDLPIEVGDSQTTEVLLGWLHHWMEDNQGTLLSQKPDRIDGFRGVHFTARYSANREHRAGIASGDALIAFRRVYFIYADVPQGELNAPEIAQFVASLDVR